MVEKVVLGFGSNIGSRLRKINSAIKILSLNKDLDLLALSSVYETEPWGFKHQRNFLNCAAVFLTKLSADELFKFIKKTEKQAGRLKRDKWQAREIDIDMLFYGNKIIDHRNLKVPHRYLQERNFVLNPLAEILPGLIHPVLKKSIAELSRISEDTGKVKVYKSHN
ncbi:MAG: 2-amino-4-hydroxy-6-hydroxymethyldihydropteridine diphosphokinase [Ignavibacteria bacterium]